MNVLRRVKEPRGLDRLADELRAQLLASAHESDALLLLDAAELRLVPDFGRILTEIGAILPPPRALTLHVRHFTSESRWFCKDVSSLSLIQH